MDRTGRRPDNDGDSAIRVLTRTWFDAVHGADRRHRDSSELTILEITQLRVLDAQRGMTEAGPAASELLLHAVGPAALAIMPEHGAVDDEGDDWPGTIAPNYFILRAASIYGGSSEVQKTIVARTLLGL